MYVCNLVVVSVWTHAYVLLSTVAVSGGCTHISVSTGSGVKLGLLADPVIEGFLDGFEPVRGHPHMISDF